MILICQPRGCWGVNKVVKEKDMKKIATITFIALAMLACAGVAEARFAAFNGNAFRGGFNNRFAFGNRFTNFNYGYGNRFGFGAGVCYNQGLGYGYCPQPALPGFSFGYCPQPAQFVQYAPPVQYVPQVSYVAQTSYVPVVNYAAVAPTYAAPLYQAPLYAASPCATCGVGCGAGACSSGLLYGAGGNCGNVAYGGGGFGCVAGFRSGFGHRR